MSHKVLFIWDKLTGLQRSYRMTEPAQTCSMTVFYLGIYCPALTLAANSTVSTDDTSFNTVIVARCDPGYIFTNNNKSCIVQCIDIIFNSTQLFWSKDFDSCQGNNSLSQLFPSTTPPPTVFLYTIIMRNYMKIYEMITSV